MIHERPARFFLSCDGCGDAPMVRLMATERSTILAARRAGWDVDDDGTATCLNCQEREHAEE